MTSAQRASPARSSPDQCGPAATAAFVFHSIGVVSTGETWEWIGKAFGAAS
jgi:hypothetical protein